MPHVLKALQMLKQDTYVSRAAFCRELELGEGSVKTLVSHLRKAGMADSAKSGTHLTEKGRQFFGQFDRMIKNECRIKSCGLFQGRYNYGVILAGCEGAIRTGLEQRDHAIVYGATGCTTIVYKDGRFVFPREESDCLQNDPKTREFLLESLLPLDGDVIIVSSADDPLVAEISAKNSVLGTLAAVP